MTNTKAILLLSSALGLAACAADNPGSDPIHPVEVQSFDEALPPTNEAQPMPAGSLQFGALEASQSPRSLFDMSFAARSPMSKLVDGHERLEVVAQDVVQLAHGASPLAIQASASAQYAKTTIGKTIGGSQSTMYAFQADGVLDGRASWSMEVVDSANGALVCSAPGLAISCELPALTASERAHHYRAVLMISNVGELCPAGGTAADVGEYKLMSREYTGYAPDHSDGSVHIIALAHASLDFGQIAFVTGAAPTTAVAMRAPNGAEPNRYESPALTWDSGEAVLPGE